MTARTYREEARERLADVLEAKGPIYGNTAGSVRAGYSNMWIDAAIEAIASTVRDPLEDE